jgi:hypothetical protein
MYLVCIQTGQEVAFRFVAPRLCHRVMDSGTEMWWSRVHKSFAILIRVSVFHFNRPLFSIFTFIIKTMCNRCVYFCFKFSF